MRNPRYNAIRTPDGPRLIDLETGEQIIPLIGAKGGVNVEPPSPVEQRMQQHNLELIKLQKDQAIKQSKEYDALLPNLYQDMGYNYSRDAKGNPIVTRMTDEQRRSIMTPEELENADIRSLANQRAKKALEGKLDVDPSVEAEIQRGEGQLRQELLAKLGPGAEGSDSWNRAMSEYKRQMDMVRYSVRHGEMTTADAIGTSRSEESMRRQQHKVANTKGATEGYGIGAGVLGGATAVTEGALNRMYGARIDRADIAMQNKQRDSSFWGGMTQGGMGLGGAAIGGAALIAV